MRAIHTELDSFIKTIYLICKSSIESFLMSILTQVWAETHRMDPERWRGGTLGSGPLHLRGTTIVHKEGEKVVVVGANPGGATLPSTYPDV